MVDQLKEEWRKVPGFSRYSVSSDGLVRRDVRIYRAPAGLVGHSKVSGGYLRVALIADDGRYVGRTVHSLVALAFHGPRPAHAVVRHLDGNPLNNAAVNLAYGSHAENVGDSIRHGTQVRGSRQHLAALSEMQVRELKLQWLAGGRSMKSLADSFGISNTTALDILSGRTWRHVEPCGDLRELVTPFRVGYRGQKKTSAIVGVSYATRSGKWVARRYRDGRPICLGEFMTEQEAIAALQLFDLTGDTRRTRSGRAERIWRLVPAQRGLFQPTKEQS